MSKAGCYAVARGRKPGIYIEWQDCEAQVLNFFGAKYKKFLNPADAELWISENARSATVRTSSAPMSRITTYPDTSPTTAPPTASTPASVAGPVPQALNAVASPSVRTTTTLNGAVQSTVPSLIAQPLVTPVRHAAPPASSTSTATGGSGLTLSDPIVVYTDGSCRGNGKVGSTAGVGVWWGKDDSRNVSERCPGHQTNNRAELIAIIRVLETAPKDRPLEIRSDSEYSMKCMNAWLPSWKRRGWKTPSGSPVKNIDLIQYADLLLEERRSVLKQSVMFKKVLAHSGEEGNEAADRLANQGAALPPVPEQNWNDPMDQVRARIRSLSLYPSVTADQSASVLRTMTASSQQQGRPSTPQPLASVSNSTSQPSSPPIETASSVSRCTSRPLSSDVSVYHRDTPSQRPRTSAELSVTGKLHGRPDLKISQKEIQVYAACLLDEDELLREAHEEGVYTVDEYAPCVLDENVRRAAKEEGVDT